MWYTGYVYWITVPVLVCIVIIPDYIITDKFRKPKKIHKLFSYTQETFFS